ncbi:ferric-dicitrate binding protein FerR, regulates iron transport through sigma-19 [Formosa sp. Hel1_31_208]|uniref:FecR family protein n=1 Tax=Formosa sp. Hel1_31_208 TaxID=1798225 RepID=UPI00087CDCE4|nr:FecR family protein [Formosa sp. Hel1_31_208]SDS19193.1 ferric-dicitrate binding protein FerR, regulates iron transport through sigma-19 [Formosa sp. Hel1_31_208]
MDKEYLIKKWLDNSLSADELKSFKALEEAAYFEEIVHEAHRFDGEKQSKVVPFDTLDTLLFQKKRASLHWLRIASRIAAIFIIGIAVFVLLNKDQSNTINTVYAQKETIILPDNSIVELNQLSQLVYSTSNWNKERNLSLEGEAFFDVKKGERFEVTTEFGVVSVLGTEFNVLSRDNIFKVSCYEGLVQVSYNNNAVKLPAGSELTLISGKGLKKSIALAEPIWLKNMSVFENTSIHDVFAELEKQYSISITFNTKTNLFFTGAFEHQDLDNALKSITQPLNLTYTIENTKEVIIKNAEE